MNQNSIKIIGRNQTSRKEAFLFYIRDVQGLIEILEQDFEEWSDFDSWANIQVQQWVFFRAMDVYKGKKIDIKCDCCEYNYNYVLQSDFHNISNQNCYGIKTGYLIERVVDEIVLAKAKRETDGTYSA